MFEIRTKSYVLEDLFDFSTNKLKNYSLQYIKGKKVF